ncbi:unnamed protein product [Psylliodes chrysocephalus]|uniref:CCHC-type domain-containing protein n=1 Tax=Psylliodes chrysocephalus TaxID=3402493 RepID=A0A9P0GE96_9CUCU|nr:unnamed protein product [Psylliodes chrysocephala]
MEENQTFFIKLVASGRDQTDVNALTTGTSKKDDHHALGKKQTEELVNPIGDKMKTETENTNAEVFYDPNKDGGNNGTMDGKTIDRTTQNNESVVFKRKDSIFRTPPPLRRAYSLNLENTSQEPKRKRDDTPEKTKTEFEIFIKKMETERNKATEQTQQLASLITTIPNTKKEIKNAIHKAESYTQKMTENTGFIDRLIEELHAPSSKRTTVAPKKIMCEMGTQTVSNQQLEKERRVMNIEKAMDLEMDDDRLQEELELQWPEDAFKKCKIHKEAITGEEENLLFIMKAEETKNNLLLRKLKEKNPQLRKYVEENKLNVGNMVGGIAKSGISGDEMAESAVELITYIALTEGLNTVEDRIKMKENLVKIKQSDDRKPLSHIWCLIDQNIAYGVARNTLEYIGRKLDISFKVITSKNRAHTVDGDEEINWELVKSKRENNEETILIKPTGNASFADILRDMKKDIKTEGITIERINKTNSGNLQLKIRGKDEKDRKTFTTALNTTLSNVAQVDVKTKGKPFMILDIDETVREEDIRQVLKREMNNENNFVDESHIKLAEKANNKGYKYAFITMQLDAAGYITRKKRIGEGWNRWRIRELDPVERCRKCHRIGHRGEQCKYKEEDRNNCHKCGEGGHKKRECTNAEHCYLCNTNGHTAETMRCPEYRNIIKTNNEEKRARLNSVF